jgi:hypothetical protein
VLSPACEIALASRDTTAWWQLLAPPRVRSEPFALVLLEAGVPVRVAVSGRGDVPPPPLELSAAGLTACARALNVAAVVAIERTVLGELAASIESALRFDRQDAVEQGLIALRVLKQRSGRGVWSEPALLDLLPAPSYEPLQRTFDALVPDDSALAAYVVSDDRARLAASIIAVKRGGDIVRVGTHRELASDVPEARLARDWPRDHERVVAAIERRFGAAPSLAIALERTTLRRILAGPGDQLARELNAKRVIIDPAPTWLLGLLGGATVAAMAGRAATALASMLPTATRERAAALAGRAKDAINPFALLGFDPLELLAQLRRFYRE